MNDDSGERGRIDKRAPSIVNVLDKLAVSFYTQANGNGCVHPMTKSLFLKTGDYVVHPNFPQWGEGVVAEERTSSLSGGVSIVRILFRDGNERSFMNDLNNHNCCYYSGVRRCEEPSQPFPARHQLT